MVGRVRRTQQSVGVAPETTRHRLVRSYKTTDRVPTETHRMAYQCAHVKDEHGRTHRSLRCDGKRGENTRHATMVKWE
jgi:hypothetical protein